MLTGDPAAENLMQRMDALETAQRTLRGEVERLQFERDGLQSEIDTLSAQLSEMSALKDRMKLHLDAVDLVNAEEKSRQQFGGTGGFTGTSQPRNDSLYSQSESDAFRQSIPETAELGQPPSSPDTFFGVRPSNDLNALPDTGRQRLAEGNFSSAQMAFQQYIDFNPTAPDIAEIRFWLGESLYGQGRYTEAAEAYLESLRSDPRGGKAPNALIRLAASFRGLGNRTEACAALADFPVQFPGADASLKSKADLEALRAGC